MNSNRHDARLSIAMLAALGLVAGAAAFAGLTGCSTVRGAGEDIQYAADRTAEALGGDTDDDDEN